MRKPRGSIVIRQRGNVITSLHLRAIESRPDGTRPQSVEILRSVARRNHAHRRSASQNAGPHIRPDRKIGTSLHLICLLVHSRPIQPELPRNRRGYLQRTVGLRCQWLMDKSEQGKITKYVHGKIILKSPANRLDPYLEAPMSPISSGVSILLRTMISPEETLPSPDAAAANAALLLALKASRR